MIATRLNYGKRINGDHMRYCSVCGTQRATSGGKFVRHQKPNSKSGDPDCPNSGQSVRKINEEAQG